MELLFQLVVLDNIYTQQEGSKDSHVYGVDVDGDEKS